MTDFLDGGVDSDGSIAAPRKPDLSLPHEYTRPVTTSTPMEDRPFRRQRRYKALVDGEETEDEQEDLQRNQRHELESNRRTVSDRQDTALGHRLGDRTSPFDLKYAYRQPDSATRGSLWISLHPVPLKSHGSDPTFGRLTIPGNSTRNNVIEDTNSSLERIENLNTQIPNMNQSQTHDVHQSIVFPMDQQQDRAGNTSTPEAAPIAVSAEVNESDLVRNIRAQVSQLLGKNAQLLETNKELSDKVKYQKFAISDLHQDVAQEKAGRETERKRADELETVLRDLRW
ncbi:hypothetical protein H9Q73_000385 [Fusarium xylarioides]|nr:hypothetical protein H9Q73_000385 [Fusarium xylarioides]